MDRIGTMVNGFQSLTVIAKLSILDKNGGPGYVSGYPKISEVSPFLQRVLA